MMGIVAKHRYMSLTLCPSFPGVQKPVDQYGSSIEAATNGDTAADEEDDFDLFGSDDDDDIVCIVWWAGLGWVIMTAK